MNADKTDVLNLELAIIDMEFWASFCSSVICNVCKENTN